MKQETESLMPEPFSLFLVITLCLAYHYPSNSKDMTNKRIL